MILTRDNLARFVCDNKFVTTTEVAEKFETSTMIASAALSGLSKDKLVAITHLKLGSTPYYYDPKQPEGLIEIGEKHLKSHEKEIFIKLKSQQIVNDGSLPIPEKLAAERLKDFAIPLEVSTAGKKFKFFIWYLRDLDETRTQIMEALNPSEAKGAEVKKADVKVPKSEVKKAEIKISKVEMKKAEVKVPKVEVIERKVGMSATNNSIKKRSMPFEVPDEDDSNESKVDKYLRVYFKENYLKIDGKKTAEKFIRYNLSLKVNAIVIKLDAIYFLKKPTDSDILKFYTSGNKPKIVFIENAAKKYFKMAESLDNLEIVNI